MEDTFVIIKPNVCECNQTVEILKKLKSNQISIIKLTQKIPNIDQWKCHYIKRQNKDYYDLLCQTLANRPILCVHLRGNNAINLIREIVPSIRKDFGKNCIDNAIHASRNNYEVSRELQLWNMID